MTGFMQAHTRAALLLSCRNWRPHSLPSFRAGWPNLSRKKSEKSHVHRKGSSRASQSQDGAGKTTSETIAGSVKSQSRAKLQWLAAPLRAYNRAQSARPYITQVLSSLTVYFLGDFLSQYIEHDQRQSSTPASANNEYQPFWTDSYSPYRSMRALLIGGTFSLPSYHWFLFLSHTKMLPAHPVPSLICKILINQLIFTTIFQLYFFSMHAILSGNSAVERVKECMPTAWTNSWKFWPIVSSINFTLIQPRSRSVFGGVVAVGWQAYLGLVKGRAGKGDSGNTARSQV